VSEPGDRYRLVMARSAAQTLTKSLPEKVATAVYEFVTRPLLENPRGVGKPLESPLAPAYSARRGTYRVLYLINDANGTVEVTAISHHADAFHM